MNSKTVIILLAAIMAFSCRIDDDPIPPTNDLYYDFEEGAQGWIGDFADLPIEGHDIYDLEIDHGQIPEETGATGNALRIQGNNRSDDLFMFFKKYIDGLEPSTSYHIVFDVEMASKYPENSMGAGGSPGSSVYVKVGATTDEPDVEIQDSYFRMNIDKGNQSQEGADMINVGTVGIEGEEEIYTLIHRGNADTPFEAPTDDQGGLWLIIGTDSGFEGLTNLYYNSVRVKLDKIVILQE